MATPKNKQLTPLFAPLKLGALDLPNRILMAPLTRSRAGGGNIPTDIMADYYGQRASAGLIVAEATQISPEGVGYPDTPGIHSEAQVQGWRLITDRVHQRGGLIALQLWHVGRISHPSMQPYGELPVAPSAIKPAGKAMGPLGPVDFVTPRALDLEEIPRVVDDYAKAVTNARNAGFDAVEIHAANGYLIDQFLRSGSNEREDAYGGTIKNRARLLMEVCEAVCGVFGADRVGVRLSPTSPFNDMRDEFPKETFPSVVAMLDSFDLAWLHIIEPLQSGPPAEDRVTPAMREQFSGAFILNGDYNAKNAAAALKSDRGDAVSFGRDFIANPDLPERLAQGLELSPSDPSTWYGGGAEGYSDYPRAEWPRAEKPAKALPTS